MGGLKIVRLDGLVPYETGLDLQNKAVAGLLDGSRPEVVILLEHEPIYTIGRLKDRSSLRGERLPFRVIETNRGGQGTYHGPEQLVGYPILDLNHRGRDLHRHLREIEDSLIQSCQTLGVEAGRNAGRTGVWCGEKKLASIGVGVRRWVSMHGFAINLGKDSLPPFEVITPCGLDGVKMTCLENEIGVSYSKKKVEEVIAAELQRRFTAR